MHETARFEIWLKGKSAEINFQQKELDALKNTGTCIVVCNRFNAKYEDAIVSTVIGKAFADYVLITTNKKSASYLDDKNILYLKKAALDSWGNVRTAIAETIQSKLEKNKSIVIFPSRPFSRFGFERMNWDKEIVATIQQMNMPVVPLFFKSSSLTDKVALFFDVFQKNKKLELNVRIGKAIKPDELKKFSGPKQFRRYLFTKTYALGSSLEVEKFYHATTSKRQEIIGTISGSKKA